VSRTAFIYGLLDPRDNTLRYVGKTVSERARLSNHLSDLTSKKKGRWVKGLLRLGLAPKMVVLSEVPASEWQKEERAAISRYRALGCDLLNVCAGGGPDSPKKPAFGKRTPLQVRVSPKVRTELKKLAASEKRTLNNYLSMLLESHIRETKQQETQAA
jgi:predicted HicB family RNase H-like nuclease